MQPIIPERRRSLHQQLVVAQRYMLLAEREGAAASAVTHDEVHRSFIGGFNYFVRSPDWEQSNLSLLFASAHMSSAAVRLSAIDETLEIKLKVVWLGSRGPRSKPGTYANALTRGAMAEAILHTNWRRWIHHMLRDQVGHAESPPDEEEGPGWEARMRVLKILRYDEVFATLSSTQSELASLLPPHYR